jgi:hypothetical protein
MKKPKARYIKTEFGGIGWKHEQDPTEEQLWLIGILAEWTRGTHHFQGNVSKCGRGIMLTTFRDGISTVDYDRLTHLVLLAHKYSVRIEIEPKGFCLGIALHKRIPFTMEGPSTSGVSLWDGHPTLLQLANRALEMIDEQKIEEKVNEN